MRTKLLVPAALAALLLLLASGCATRTTASGGRETHVLGGAVSVSTNSFQPVSPATINTDVSTIVGRKDPSGSKVSLLWGLLTFHDY